MNKKGFSPLEILISLAIFSFLGTLLFQALFQINKSLKSVTVIAASDMRYLLFDNLWEKELAGAFVPQLKKAGKSGDEEESLQSTADEKKDSDSKKDGQGEKKEKEKLITPPKSFFCDSGNGGNIKLFTFITTNPLAVYNMRKPRVMRIVYELKPDKDGQGLFALYRKEIDGIFEESKILSKEGGKEKSFKVFGGIKSLKIEFFAESVKKKDDPKDESPQLAGGDGLDGKKDDAGKDKNKEEEKEEPREFKKLQSWDPEEVEKLAEEGKEMKLVPAFVQVTLVLEIDHKEMASREYIFAPLYDQQNIILKGIKPPEDPKKEQAKGSQGNPPPSLPGGQMPPTQGSPGQAGSRGGPLVRPGSGVVGRGMQR